MGIHEYQINVSLPKIEEKIRTAEYSETNKNSILKFESYQFAAGLNSLGILKSLTVLNIITTTAKKDFKDMDKLVLWQFNYKTPG